jgi:hypothetical protein
LPRTAPAARSGGCVSNHRRSGPDHHPASGVRFTPHGDRHGEGDELIERTLDYSAQHRDASVWYFGERIDDY